MAVPSTNAINTIKNISLTGGAVDDYNRLKGNGRRRRGGTRKRRDEFEDEGQFGGDSPPGSEIRLTSMNLSRASNLSKNATITKIGGGTLPPDPITGFDGVQPPVKLPVIANPATVAPGTIAQNPKALDTLPAIKAQIENNTQPIVGGAKKTILTPKKQKTKTLLAPPTSSKKAQTRSVKDTRKIKVQLANMKKRVTTAKIIHKDSKEKSIGEIRKLLEEAKLVKPAKEGKKVPEDILRNIYRDYLILRNKAL